METAASGAQAWDIAMRCATSLPGKVFALATAFALAYHFWNGVRHLLWDIGWGYEIRTVYITGYAVVGLALMSTLVLAMLALRAGGAA